MAYQKLQVSEALPVIKGKVMIPDPTSVVCLDTATGATKAVADFSAANTLTAVGTKFTEAGIKTGAIVYNTTANKAYYVVKIVSDTQLTLSTGTAGGAADVYTIYTKPTVGCILFVGTGGDVAVQMAENNGNLSLAAMPANFTTTFKNISSGCWMPTQVVRLDGSTTAEDVIALW